MVPNLLWEGAQIGLAVLLLCVRASGVHLAFPRGTRCTARGAGSDRSWLERRIAQGFGFTGVRLPAGILRVSSRASKVRWSRVVEQSEMAAKA